MTDKVQKILEEVVRLHNLLPVMDGDNISINYADRICTALKMYIDSLQEEPVSEDLEEEIERHLKECLDVKFPTTNIELIKKDVRYTAKHFVNWQMQQLMKNVVLETEVLLDSDGDGVETPYESWLTLANTEIPELPESLGLKEGDKVKIVIVKSE